MSLSPAVVPLSSAPAWVSAESYWHPERIVLSAWLEHAPFAFWLMSVLRPAVTVELGTHNGFSFFAFCEAAARLGIDAKVFAVDTWAGDEHAGFYEEEVFAEVSSHAETYPDIALLLRGYFSDHVGSFEAGSVNLLHIDGRHGYEDVKEDFESWLPTVDTASGVVLLHDIAVFERGFGVHRFWKELQDRFPSFGFEHGNGLGVVAVGTNPPEPVRALTLANAAEARRIREFYAARGAIVTRDWNREADHIHDVEQFHQSTSWRVTRPLRFVAERFRRR